MPISDWPSEDRPREKLLSRGADALTDAELLAIFLRTGTRGKSAVDLARDLLHRYGSLTRLSQASLEDFSQTAGLGSAKYAQLKAVIEMARRALAEEMRTIRVAFNSPAAVREYLRLWLGAEQREVFVGLFLDSQHRLLVSEELAAGSIREARIYPREVAKRCLQHNAAGLIVAHNHPSGLAEPSEADVSLTRHLKSALALLDIDLLDHFIVTGSEAVSLAEQGRI
ncbi:RadC family protein [Parachitinimonas caeni]|uniref:DNA repair protein RadC n=1 Tax=Parachitinimonas caeni TaxID=3031301 RepID=A0ABT7DUR9_9NEIS|nr:DNA repair protein RadC [Parachitinimonas caeni]MDK2123810.1 DNA repair protein RadC [Parachitinimonas caeni]